MKIDYISAQFPSKILSIDETLDMIRFCSKKSFKGDIEKALKILNKILLYSGAKERRCLNKGEKPLDFIVKSVHEALKGSNNSIDDIDLLIYTGIGRGFLEPGESYILAKNLGMKNVECFDLLDACMSWTRALNISYQYVLNNKYRKILIVNGEFNNIKGGAFFPRNYRLSNLSQIKWTFPTFTIGDAATATVISKDNSASWEWHFITNCDMADLCTIPMAGFSMFTKSYEKIGRNGQGRFCSFGNDMHKLGTPEVINIFKKLSISKEKIRMVFPHASSEQAWAHCAEVCGVSDKMFYVYPQYGNLVSASVPAGMALAIQQKRIKKGDQIVIWVGSAGMSFAVVGFTL